MLTLNYQPEKDDFAMAFRAFYRDAWKSTIPLVIIILIPIFCLVILAPPRTITTWIAILLPIVIVVGLILYVFIIHPNKAANQLMENDLTKGPSTIEIDDEKIRIVSNLNENTMEWSGFNRVLETNELFILVFTTNVSGIRIIPKRLFASDADVQYFSALVDEKISRNPAAIKMLEKQKQAHRKRTVVTILWVSLVALGIIMISIPR
jgi:hypothetical protein